MARLLSSRTVLARLDEERQRTGAAAFPPCAFLVLEVDRWHELHCSRGGTVQRQVLAEAGHRLARAAARQRDARAGLSVAGRVSDAVFVAVQRGIDDPGALAKTAAALQELLAMPYEIDGQRLHLTVSCGVAPLTTAHACAADALAEAMAALAAARQRGGGGRTVFDDALQRTMSREFELSNGLRHALRANSLALHFQPIVSLDTGRPMGLEALLRWPRSDTDILAPDEFIAVAEGSDLIVEIDRWVIEATCRQLRNWLVRAEVGADLPISVNVSGCHFARPDLLATIDRSLRAAGLYGRSLIVEITESAMMENAPFTRDMLAQLRALGVRVNIDDFGTGYASLANLRQFDVDALKIDRTFVARVDTDPECREIVRTVINLAEGLGKRVIAEGIEATSQRDTLRGLGCRLGQGFLFAPPMPATAVPPFLRRASEDDLFTA